jgi:hypothetical protein
MKVLIALLFAASEVLWACPGIGGINLKDGENQILGLDSVRIEKGATIIQAGDVTYKIFSTYANDGTALDPKNLTDQDERVRNQQVCMEVKGKCGKDVVSKMCFKGTFGNNQPTPGTNLCAGLKDTIKMSATGLKGMLTDSSGVQKATIHLKADLNVRSDFVRPGEMRDLSAAHDRCKSEGKSSTACQIFALSKDRYEHLRSIENSVMQYSVTLSSKSNKGDSYTIASEDHYYRNVGGEDGVKLEPVELNQDSSHIENLESPTAMIERYSVTKVSGDKKSTNQFEFVTDNYSPKSRSIARNDGPSGFDIGTPKSTAVVSGCEITGGDPVRRRDGAGGQGESATR